MEYPVPLGTGSGTEPGNKGQCSRTDQEPTGLVLYQHYFAAYTDLSSRFRAFNGIFSAYMQCG
jgi:hypothetical protein